MSLDCTIIAFVEQQITKSLAAAGKPSYAWGRGGANTDGSYLDNHGVPSNKVGIPFGLNNGLLTELWVGNELLAEFDINIFHHLGDEVSLTLLTTVTVPAAARTKTFNAVDLGVVNVPKDVQIACQVVNATAGSPRNTSVHATITGSP